MRVLGRSWSIYFQISMWFRRFTALLSLGLVLLSGCGGGGSSSSVTTSSTSNTATPLAANAINVQVTGGIQGGFSNLLMASVTVCIHGATRCQTIDNVQVDTGSTGLRLLASALSGLALPAIAGNSNGSTLYECADFADGVVWGQMATADVKLASELASNLPIQIIADTSAFASMPRTCSDLGSNQSSLAALGANGILGVGLFAQDGGAYFSCTAAGSCSSTQVDTANRTSNPVASFSTDNNGVVIQLPAVGTSGTNSLSGSLIFGINTQSNNQLVSSATVISVPATGPQAGYFSVTLNGQTLPDSFMDTGSGAYFFDDSGLPVCAHNSTVQDMYCPGSSQAASQLSLSVNLAGHAVTVNVANASFLYQQSTNGAENAVFSNLAGTTGGVLGQSFDFGLPFFFGRTVYTGFAVPGNTSGPYYAFQ